jgi:site-specific recombinase XerD
MLEDARMRQLAPKTQAAYIRAVSKLAAFTKQSPDTASAEDLRRFQLHMVDAGTSPITLNANITGLTFFFDVTLGRPDVMARMQSVRVPQKLPTVLSREEVSRLLGAVGHPACDPACAGNRGLVSTVCVARAAGECIGHISGQVIPTTTV